MDILTRFLNYVSIPTSSNSSRELCPSTNSQKKLASILVEELKDMGLLVHYDEEHCYVYGLLKGNCEAPKLGFISHLDTSQNAKGEDIHPRIIKNYDGKDIQLKEDVVMKVDRYPDLKNHVGKTLITTDGSTLLGADDKAGIAEIMTMLEYFATSSDCHGDIYVCFTPDEEIGRGVEFINLDLIPAQFAYTVDGISLGEITYDNFNAASAQITIHGTSAHLGSAKGVLVNALEIACKINGCLPEEEKPEFTEGYEGFFHLKEMKGDSNFATMKYLIRDFDKMNFLLRKKKIEMIVSQLNRKYNGCIDLEIKDTYYNMKDIIAKNWHLIEKAKQAMEKLDIPPISGPIRGGTDGAELTFMGLPCPNLGTGGHNFHSVYEYISLEDMIKASELLIGIVKEYAYDKDILKKTRSSL